MIKIHDVTSSADRAKTSGAGKNRSLRVPKASEILASNIKKQIVSGELKEGDHLPAEANLMEQFDVSRPTIREAYRILEAQQLVTVARGAKGGAIVHAPTPALITEYTALLMQAERVTMDEIYQARNAYEPAIVRLVATHARATAPAILRACLDNEDELLRSPESSADAVEKFHKTLIDLSGNRPLIYLYSSISTVIKRYEKIVMALQHRAMDGGHSRSTQRGFKSYRKLIDLIEAGDVDGAEQHWRVHNEQAYKSWINNFEKTTVLDLMSDML